MTTVIETPVVLGLDKFEPEERRYWLVPVISRPSPRSGRKERELPPGMDNAANGFAFTLDRQAAIDYACRVVNSHAPTCRIDARYCCPYSTIEATEYARTNGGQIICVFDPQQGDEAIDWWNVK